MLIQETIMCSGVKQSAFSSVADAGAFSKIQIAVSTWPSSKPMDLVQKGPLQNSYVSYIVLILPMPISGPEDQYQVGRIPEKRMHQLNPTELQQSCSWTGLTSMAYSVLGSPWRWLTKKTCGDIQGPGRKRNSRMSHQGLLVMNFHHRTWTSKTYQQKMQRKQENQKIKREVKESKRV